MFSIGGLTMNDHFLQNHYIENTYRQTDTVVSLARIVFTNIFLKTGKSLIYC